ncbi:hypothetical protein CENSYa_0758 [Cenarchaeum symbiosum A]|uniref:Uncharacterized protein n=1 Tax=Cenarchaeum symbiosum (strain A) TaxID=414004 RepID=A0RVM4_CENSY|nr:hypothetical protein CENSYa_0758 [Cenarchaeum symbiosum A]
MTSPSSTTVSGTSVTEFDIPGRVAVADVAAVMADRYGIYRRARHQVGPPDKLEGADWNEPRSCHIVRCIILYAGPGSKKICVASHRYTSSGTPPSKSVMHIVSTRWSARPPS